MIHWLRQRYEKVKRFVPAAGFVFGAVWDTVTLRRIDNAFDLSMQGAFLVLSGVVVILICRKVKFRFSHFLPVAGQFFYGGLLSAYRVYYFKSAASLPSLVFMLVVVAAVIGNEFLEKKLNDSQVALTMFSLCCVMYLNFLLPVVLHIMNVWVFLAAVAIALSSTLAVRSFAAAPTKVIWPTIGIYALLVLLYLANVIPPVPLSKKGMGIYHSVSKRGAQYFCTMERPSWQEFWKEYDRVYHYAPGDTVFCFSSVFAPVNLKTQIAHQWYRRDPTSGRWIPRGTISYPMVGGREEGYCGFTYTRNVEPGKWKVVLRTDEGKALGIVTFTVVPRDTSRALQFKQVIK
jgi:hypothetical protein